MLQLGANVHPVDDRFSYSEQKLLLISVQLVMGDGNFFQKKLYENYWIIWVKFYFWQRS